MSSWGRALVFCQGEGPTWAGALKFSWCEGPAGAGVAKFSWGKGPSGSGVAENITVRGPAGDGAGNSKPGPSHRQGQPRTPEFLDIYVNRSTQFDCFQLNSKILNASKDFFPILYSIEFILIL